MAWETREQSKAAAAVRRTWNALALAAPLAMTTVTGCGTTDDEARQDPVVGTSTSRNASDSLEKISSSIHDLIGVKGKSSETRPGVSDCSGRDRETHFSIFHPWSFYPASASDVEVAMHRLRSEIPENGWKIVDHGPDTSKNENITLIADHGEKKVGVKITQRSKNDPPKLSFDVVSGCYRVPSGQKVERF